MSELMMTLIQFLQEQNFLFMLPEVILTLGLLVVAGLTIIGYKKSADENLALMQTALIFILLSLSVLMWNYRQLPPTSADPVMFGAMSADLFAYLMRMLLLIGAGVTVAMAHRFVEQHTRVVGDFYILIMGATLGGMFLASATDLILVFVGLETLSITSYILAGYLRKTVRSAEASLKYLVYGGMGTSVFLFGLSLIYGLVGSTNFRDIANVLVQYQGIEHPTLVVLILMVAAALAFKLSSAPFHMWTPDVYEGAPTPVSGFLSVVSKTAAFAVTIRMLMVLFPGFEQWATLWIILSVLSMTIGNFVALKQRTVKRLLAYSTIAHAGYMLLALVVGNVVAVGSLIYYLIAYLFMNLGAFASAIYFTNLTRSDEIDAYSGLVQKRPGMVLGFSFCLLSLTGIPITAGFFAKFFLFQAVAQAGPVYLWLVIIALINSTVSMAYYLNLIRLMVVKEPSAAVKAIPAGAESSLPLSTALTVSVVGTLLLGIFASPFFELSRTSVEQLVQQRPVMVSHEAPVKAPSVTH